MSCTVKPTISFSPPRCLMMVVLSSHFQDDERKAQRGQKTCPSHTAVHSVSKYLYQILSLPLVEARAAAVQAEGGMRTDRVPQGGGPGARVGYEEMQNPLGGATHTPPHDSPALRILVVPHPGPVKSKVRRDKPLHFWSTWTLLFGAEARGSRCILASLSLTCR